jgi:hypothetical protein
VKIVVLKEMDECAVVYPIHTAERATMLDSQRTSASVQGSLTPYELYALLRSVLGGVGRIERGAGQPTGVDRHTSGVIGNSHWPGKGLEPRRPMLLRGGRYLPVCTLRLMSTFGYISSLFHTSHTLKRYHSQLNSCESITFSAIAPIELLNLDSQLEP